MFFLVIPHKIGALKKYDYFDFNRLKSDSGKGLLHIIRGFGEFFSKEDVNYSDFWPYGHPNGYRRLIYSDNPFSYETAVCDSGIWGVCRRGRWGCRTRSGGFGHYVLDPLKLS